ncbi:hypothetical protein [Paraoerskovia marina]|uniref:hypothetical protein n=1 Tax=Paraoerskovia marina TaxID=545619 RepID=UPI0009F5BF20|nr:hypothetical protein [Paraoerskovia marina]
MALMPRLRQLIRRQPTSTIGARRPTTSGRRGDTVHEDALRAMLADDPNDARAFQALAEIVRRRAADAHVPDDPLAAPVDEQEVQRAADLAVWSLAEELAGNPRGWYPLVELGRLSVDEDLDGALRRFATATDRDPTGQALAESVVGLRESGHAVDALGLGIGHWRTREHVPEVGRQLVLAALDADRVADARNHLDALAAHPDSDAVKAMTPELERAITQREQSFGR